MITFLYTNQGIYIPTTKSIPSISGWTDLRFVATPDLEALLADEDTMGNATIRVFTIADYFGLSYMGDMAANQFSDTLKLLAKKVHAKRDSDGYGISDAFVTSFFEAAAAAYSSPLPSIGTLQKAFLKFFELTRFIVLRDQRFRANLQEIPALSHAILLSLVNADGPSLVVFNQPALCYGCHRDLRGDYCPVTWFSPTPKDDWEPSGPAGLCERCARVLEEDPTSFGLS